MHIEFFLVSLQGRRGVGGRQDVALDEVGAFGAGVEAFFELVGCALALEFEGFGLEGTKKGRGLVWWKRGVGREETRGEGVEEGEG